jgi:hypothetical protein
VSSVRSDWQPPHTAVSCHELLEIIKRQVETFPAGKFKIVKPGLDLRLQGSTSTQYPPQSEQPLTMSVNRTVTGARVARRRLTIKPHRLTDNQGSW